MPTAHVPDTAAMSDSADAVGLGAMGVSLAAILASPLASWWLRRHDTPADQPLGFAAICCAAVITMFLTLTQQVVGSGWLTGSDKATLGWFVAQRNASWTTTAMVVTTMGSPAGIAGVGGVMAAILTWRRRTPTPAAVLLGTLAATAVTNIFTKMAVSRQRPPRTIQLVTVNDFAYPSGHVAGTVALVGALVGVCWSVWRKWVRILAAGGAAAVVAAVAVSRLYLGLHWLTDVIGGALLGAAVVFAARLIVTAITSPRLDVSASGERERRGGRRRDRATEATTGQPS
jgi:membrane-associated phospholipid phosphatase